MSGIKRKLTQKYVDAVAPEGKRFIVWDTEIAAFGLRVLPTGAKAYIICYRIGQGRLARADDRAWQGGKSALRGGPAESEGLPVRGPDRP